MKKFLRTIALMAGVLAAGLAFAEQAAPARDLQAEEANRTLVLEFYDRVFTRHETEQAAEVLADDYRQHNPRVPNGKDAFVNYFTGFFKENPKARNRVVRSATDGELVWLHVHSTSGKENDRGRAIVDIFRVNDGKIVEHWDVIQPVPEHSANGNSMF